MLHRIVSINVTETFTGDDVRVSLKCVIKGRLSKPVTYVAFLPADDWEEYVDCDARTVYGENEIDLETKKVRVPKYRRIVESTGEISEMVYDTISVTIQPDVDDAEEEAFKLYNRLVLLQKIEAIDESDVNEVPNTTINEEA